VNYYPFFLQRFISYSVVSFRPETKKIWTVYVVFNFSVSGHLTTPYISSFSYGTKYIFLVFFACRLKINAPHAPGIVIPC
jgi:hypothetical protein